MQVLEVQGVEDGSLVLVAPGGERFLLPVDAQLLGRIAARAGEDRAKRPSPKEIQAHVRAGLSPQQVADLTGVGVASIERFVGPVLAERAYVLDSAMAVRLPPEAEGGVRRAFGAVMTERLGQIDAADVVWRSAKEGGGWIVAVAFRADGVQHDARWRFEPRRQQLDPENVEASTLSQAGASAALTPRLRAIEPTAPVTVVPLNPALDRERARPGGGPDAADRPPAALRPRTAPAEAPARFDSGAFVLPPDQLRPAGSSRDPFATGADDGARATRSPAEETPTAPLPVPAVSAGHVPGDVFAARPTREPAAGVPRPVAELRRDPARPAQDRSAQDRGAQDRGAQDRGAQDRGAQDRGAQDRSAQDPSAQDRDRAAQDRRGQHADPGRRRRERGGADAASGPAGRTAFGVRPDQPTATPTAPAPAPPSASRPRRGRTSMPSWDEIVFGRDDDDAS